MGIGPTGKMLSGGEIATIVVFCVIWLVITILCMYRLKNKTRQEVVLQDKKIQWDYYWQQHRAMQQSLQIQTNTDINSNTQSKILNGSTQQSKIELQLDEKIFSESIQMNTRNIHGKKNIIHKIADNKKE